MLESILGAVLLGQSAPVSLDTPIASASVYKHGLLMAVREGALQQGDHVYELTTIPLAYEGSFWPQPVEGVTMGDIRSSVEMVKTKVKVPATSIIQLIEFNINRTITLVQPLPDGKERRITGKVLGLAQNQVTITDSGGIVRSVPLYGDLGVVAKGLVFEKEMPQTKPRIRVTFRASSSKANARIKFLTLEQGAAWTNHYLLDLDGKEARLSNKATLGLGGLKLDGTKIDLVAGRPELNLGNRYDLSLGGTSLYEFLTMSGNTRLPNPYADPYDLLEQVMRREQQKMQSGPQGGPWGGGFGGLGGGGGSLSEEGGVMFDSAPAPELKSLNQAQQVEDAYIIPMGRVTMNPGDRLTRVLHDEKRPVDRTFKGFVNLGNFNSLIPITSTVQIENKTEAAWTAGPILVISQSTPQTIVIMPFTGPGATADIALGQARDIVATSEVEVTKREVVRTENNVPVVRQTVEFRIKAANRRTTDSKVELTTTGEGVLEDAGGAVSTVLPTNGRDPGLRLVWTSILRPGEEKTFVARYTRYE